MRGARSWRAPLFRRFVVLLAPAHPQVDREADAPDGARPRALPDDPAAQRSPRANATHRADTAAGPADPRPRHAEPQPDHPRHAAASRWWWRRWRRWRWRRRWWWRRWRRWRWWRRR